MSIVRIGMGEHKNYADGFEAIFGKKKAGAAKASASKKPAKKATKKASKKK